MRHFSFVLLALALAAPAVAGAEAVSLDDAVAAVSATRPYADVARLSSPELAGRLTGTPGYDGAARFAAASLRAAGLEALPGHADMMLPFPVTVAGVDRASLELLPTEAGGDDGRRLEFFDDFLPMLYSGSGSVTAEVVFVGYGITAPELGRDDYAGIDVTGKIVMAVRGAPRDGRDWTAHDSHRARTATAKAHGAAGYLFAESAAANPNGEPLTDFPMATVTREVGDAILSGTGLTLEELGKVLRQGGTASFSTGRRLRLDVTARAPHPGTGANVVAVLPGSDSAERGEYVIVGAHLDHCGNWPVLLPGADDNASGAATVLEIARAAARLEPRPPRSLVFVLFGGEEMGLLGSKAMAASLPASLGRCVGVFNLDMVGVGTGAWVAAGKNFPDLFAALERARDRWEPAMSLRAGLSEGEARADHGPFQHAGIPAVSLFGSGASHHGYHSDEDSIWWITPRTMQAVGRIVLGAAVSVAGLPVPGDGAVPGR